jgi:hypothetical protein
MYITLSEKGFKLNDSRIIYAFILNKLHAKNIRKRLQNEITSEVQVFHRHIVPG